MRGWLRLIVGFMCVVLLIVVELVFLLCVFVLLCVFLLCYWIVFMYDFDDDDFVDEVDDLFEVWVW